MHGKDHGPIANRPQRQRYFAQQLRLASCQILWPVRNACHAHPVTSRNLRCVAHRATNDAKCNASRQKKTHLPVQLWRWDSALLNEGQLFSSAASLRQKKHVPVPCNIGNNTSFLEMPVSCKKTC